MYFLFFVVFISHGGVEVFLLLQVVWSNENEEVGENKEIQV